MFDPQSLVTALYCAQVRYAELFSGPLEELCSGTVQLGSGVVSTQRDNSGTATAFVCAATVTTTVWLRYTFQFISVHSGLERAWFSPYWWTCRTIQLKWLCCVSDTSIKQSISETTFFPVVFKTKSCIIMTQAMRVQGSGGAGRWENYFWAQYKATSSPGNLPS